MMPKQTETPEPLPYRPPTQPAGLSLRDPNECERVVFLFEYRIGPYGGTTTTGISPHDSILAWSPGGEFLLARHRTTGEEMQLPADRIALVFPSIETTKARRETAAKEAARTGVSA
jgi:hypothetical protein